MRVYIPLASCSSLTRLQVSRTSTAIAKSSFRRTLQPIRFASSVPPTDRDPAQAPAKKRGGSKLFKDADEAVADIKSGSIILSAGFGVCGTAGALDRNGCIAVSSYANDRIYHCCYPSAQGLG